jgi:hypothetical protein
MIFDNQAETGAGLVIVAVPEFGNKQSGDARKLTRRRQQAKRSQVINDERGRRANACLFTYPPADTGRKAIANA